MCTGKPKHCSDSLYHWDLELKLPISEIYLDSNTVQFPFMPTASSSSNSQVSPKVSEFCEDTACVLVLGPARPQEGRRGHFFIAVSVRARPVIRFWAPSQQLASSCRLPPANSPQRSRGVPPAATELFLPGPPLLLT